MAENKKGLGRGLSALFGDDEPNGTQNNDQSTRGLKMISVSELQPGPYQPRRHFDTKSIQDLAQSLKNHGVLQPLVARRVEGHYEIVAGERRWRAAQKAQIHELPVIVRTLSDDEVAQIGLVENLQREDLNPLEEAQTYKQLIEHFGHTQEELSGVIGKSRSHIANSMRLLSLPAGVQTLVVNGSLSAGHARTIIGLENADQLARQAIREDLSVRALEQLVKQSQKPRKPSKKPIAKGPDIKNLEKELSLHLGCDLKISNNGSGKGKIIISYSDLDQFDVIFNKLAKP